MRCLQIVCLCLVFLSCGERREVLRVATSANMQYAINKLIDGFYKESGIPCEAIVASSGQLTTQMMQGAPFDIFVSADMNYPQKLFDEGYAEKPPVEYAQGVLVYWSMDSTVSFESLRGKSIAIANPQLAPYGEAAKSVLLKEGYLLSNKIITGNSISQVNHFVLTGAVHVGLTSLSTLREKEPVKGAWQAVDTTLYQTIRQGVVVMKSSEQKEAAKQFCDFLQSSTGKELLIRYGYRIDHD